MIPKCKIGNCSQCELTNTNCVKVGKQLFCLKCHRNNKSKKQISKVFIKKENNDLQKWFEYVATVINSNPNCWECGEYIPKKYYRHASAHIFPKSIFTSVNVHPFNFLILAASCGCHAKFDSSLESAAKMKVFDIAIKRFKLFEKNIEENHKYLNLFKDEVEKRA